MDANTLDLIKRVKDEYLNKAKLASNATILGIFTNLELTIQNDNKEINKNNRGTRLLLVLILFLLTFPYSR
jgi:hypothetical protein